MNNETESEKLASNIAKINDIDKRLGELERLYSNPKVFLDTWVRPVVGLEIAAATQIEKQGDRIDNFLREISEQEKFRTNIRINLRNTFLAIVSSVLVSSIFAATSLLLMAIVTDRLEYLIGLAVPIAFSISTLSFGYLYWPGSAESRRSLFVRFGKRILRIVKRA